MLTRPSSPTAARGALARNDGAQVGWAVSTGLVGYPEAVEAMETRVAEILAGTAPELIWLLEHPPLYTAGVSARPGELLDPGRFPVFRSGRGGRFTYHGPGQRVAYVMLDLAVRGRDLRAFVRALQAWVIGALDELDVEGTVREGRVGVWVEGGPAGEAKIAAIGVKLRRWVSFHGVSLNVSPDLSHFDGIVPCGVREFGVTSLAELGRPTGLRQADAALRRAFTRTFGPAEDASAPL